ncbi:unknown [Prevotella sp. CAG:1185]|nr:unknown [Prevotella sp. CAG:1185]
MKERRRGFCGVERGGRKFGQHAVEAVEGYVEVGSDNLVAQTDGLSKELAIKGYGKEALCRGIFRIEQTDVCLVETKIEVVSQHAVIKQQLNIMRLKLQALAARLCGALYVEVAPRLLLNKQAEVGGHEVDTALKAKTLADKRRLEHNSTAVVFAEHARNGGVDIGCLHCGVCLKHGRIEVGAG